VGGETHITQLCVIRRMLKKKKPSEILDAHKLGSPSGSAHFPSSLVFLSNVKSFTWNGLHGPSGIFFENVRAELCICAGLWLKYNVHPMASRRDALREGK